MCIFLIRWGFSVCTSYSRIILASTVIVPVLYAMTGLRSSSLISGCSMTKRDVLHKTATRALMSAGGVFRYPLSSGYAFNFVIISVAS